LGGSGATRGCRRSTIGQALGVTIDIDWEHEQLDCFDRLALKSYNTAVHSTNTVGDIRVVLYQRLGKVPVHSSHIFASKDVDHHLASASAQAVGGRHGSRLRGSLVFVDPLGAQKAKHGQLNPP
jgi:hypothetical protein